MLVTKTHTHRGDYLFRVGEGAMGEPFIWLEARYGGPEFEIKVGGAEGEEPTWRARAMITMELRPGTTLEQAEEVARYLNEHLGLVMLTTGWEEEEPDDLPPESEAQSKLPLM